MSKDIVIKFLKDNKGEWGLGDLEQADLGISRTSLANNLASIRKSADLYGIKISVGKSFHNRQMVYKYRGC